MKTPISSRLEGGVDDFASGPQDLRAVMEEEEREEGWGDALVSINRNLESSVILSLHKEEMVWSEESSFLVFMLRE